MVSFRKQLGFTLMELMIVVGIMAILAMAAIPAYQGYLATSRVNTHFQNYEEARRFIAAECSKALAGGVRVDVITTLNSNGNKLAPGNTGGVPAFADAADQNDPEGQVIITGLNNDGTVEPGNDVTVSLGTAAVGATNDQYPGSDGTNMPPASIINCASN
jgi:prepilin-type N-terminal cleavage/methylation domain-containing protein